MIMASLKFAGRSSMLIHLVKVARVASVVVRDNWPPQQWLSAMYEPVLPADVKRVGCLLPSCGPTSITLVGRGVSVAPEHRGSSCCSTQVRSQSRTRQKLDSDPRFGLRSYLPIW